MTITIQAIQVTNLVAQLQWTSTDADPALGWELSREVNAPSPVQVLAQLAGAIHLFTDDIAGLLPGDVIEYSVQDLDTLTIGLATITLADLDAPFTFGPVNPLADQIRYTTLADVKARLGITHAETDDLLSDAIISAEVAIDQWNGRSFPDTGANPEIPGVPQAIATWATDASIAIWKAADAPFGQGGGDAWLGALDIQTITERVLRRHPLSLGYKVSWGVA